MQNAGFIIFFRYTMRPHTVDTLVNIKVSSPDFLIRIIVRWS